MVIKARGEAAHTSTDKGISSNFLIAPFLAEMAHLKECFMTEAEVIRLSCEVTGEPRAITVPYATEAFIYQKYLPLVILGPGSIAQAHTVGSGWRYVSWSGQLRSIKR